MNYRRQDMWDILEKADFALREIKFLKDAGKEKEILNLVAEAIDIIGVAKMKTH